MSRRIYWYPMIAQAMLTGIALVLLAVGIINADISSAIMLISFVASEATIIAIMFKIENHV